MGSKSSVSDYRRIVEMKERWKQSFDGHRAGRGNGKGLRFDRHHYSQIEWKRVPLTISGTERVECEMWDRSINGLYVLKDCYG